MRLEGKVALISGAASGVDGELMGFGGAAARMFCREGAKVVLGDINTAGGERTAEQIRSAGGDAMFVKLDVTSEQDWIDAVAAAVSAYGKLNVLVNNAGTGARFTVEETTEEAWDGQIDVHAKGTFLGTKHAIPEMLKEGAGSIVNISSIYGIVGSPTSTAYHAAKGGDPAVHQVGGHAVRWGQHTDQFHSSGVLPYAIDDAQLRERTPFFLDPGAHTHRAGGQRRRYRLRDCVSGVGRIIVYDRV